MSEPRSLLDERVSEISVPLKAHLWARHHDDFYVEPKWCSRRLFETEFFSGDIFDPACGLGRIVESAHQFGHAAAFGSDIVARSPTCRVAADFLQTNVDVKNIVSNPPFRLAEEFTRHALRSARDRVALLLPSKWLYGDKRSRWLEETPLRKVLALTPRPSMPPGPVIEAGIDPGGGREDFSFFIWDIGYRGRPEIGWLRRDP